MSTLLGPNWKTTVIGFVAAVINYVVNLGTALPSTPHEWGAVLFSAVLFALGMSAKDHNVSNAPTPVPAKPVS